MNIYERLFSFSGVVLYSLKMQWLQLCHFMCNAHKKYLLSFSFRKGMESTLSSPKSACAILVEALLQTALRCLLTFLL